MEPTATRLLRAVTASPGFNLAVFALLLNFPWKLLQAPLFEGMAAAAHSTVMAACLRGTLRDAVIMLLAHASVAGVTRRRWVLAPSGCEVAGFVAVGMAITEMIKWLAIRGPWVQSWAYSSEMPLIPGTGFGLSPLLQWVVLPAIALWFVRRQLAPAGR